jgi:hypothetical protein
MCDKNHIIHTKHLSSCAIGKVFFARHFGALQNYIKKPQFFVWSKINVYHIVVKGKLSKVTIFDFIIEMVEAIYSIYLI